MKLKPIGELSDRWKEARVSAAKFDGGAWAGLAGETLSAADVAAAARLLYEHLSMRPLPELAAVATISGVHVVDRPVRAPQFAPDNTAESATLFKAFRVNDSDDMRRKLLNALKDVFDGKAGAKWPLPEGNPGDTGIVVSGRVLFDRETSRQIELRATCALPSTTVFDDPVRFGRTARDRLVGIWPYDLQSDDKNKYLLGDKLFGFSVDSQGRVTLPRGTVTLTHFDDLGPRDPSATFFAPNPLDLVQEQINSLDKADGKAAVTPNESGQVTRALAVRPIADTLARKLYPACARDDALRWLFSPGDSRDGHPSCRGCLPAERVTPAKYHLAKE